MKTVVIPTRATIEEKHSWATQAAQEGLDLSNWIRLKCNGIPRPGKEGRPPGRKKAKCRCALWGTSCILCQGESNE